jgi:glycosyltransferase involved in cell wall biosynthesis
LSTQDDSVMTVVTFLSREHAARGGRAAVILSDNRDVRVDGVENVFVDYTRYCPKEWFSRWEVSIDQAAGVAGLARPYHSKLFIPAIEAAAAIDPDVILLHESHYAAVSLPRWRRACPRARVLLYVHVNLSRSYLRHELKRLLADADGVICVSRDSRRAVLSRAPWIEDKTFVVENGVDTALFRPGPVERAPAPGEDAVEVLFVGRVVPSKGPDRLLAALDVARRRTSVPLRARVVGSSRFEGGPLSEYETGLRDLARDRKLDVEFVPFVAHDEVPDLYRRATLVAVPSVYRDPYPLVVLEAMACGAPVVASDRGGVPEAGGDAARYVDPDDADGFGAVLAELADDAGERARMSDRSLARARSNSWSARYDTLMDVISGLG